MATKACELCAKKYERNCLIRRKIKCVLEGDEKRCSSCIKYQVDCVFKERKKRGPDAQRLVSLKRDKAILEELLANQERLRAQGLLAGKPPLPISPNNFDSIRRETLKKYTQFDFFLIFIADIDGTKLSFTDFYFKYTFRWLPILSKNFITTNLLETDLHLIHAMYACCLINYTKTGSKLDLAKIHISIAFELVYENLEDPTPMTVATLLHLVHFYRAIDNLNQWTSHLAVAIRIAKLLGFQNDTNLYWNSTKRTLLNSNNICRGMWLMLYYFDFSSQFADDIAFMIFEEKRTENILINHTSVNWDDPSGIPENALTYSKYLIPLFRQCKQKYLLESKNEPPSVMKAFLAEFDQWFYIVLPHSFRYNVKDSILKQKVIGLVNFIYFHTKLGVLKHEFLEHVSLPKSITGPVIPNFSDIVSTIEVIRTVCKLYIEFKIAEPNNVVTHDSIYFKQSVYKCGMFCLILDKYGSYKMIDLKQSLEVFGKGLDLMPGGAVLNDHLKTLARSDLKVVINALSSYHFSGQFH